MKSISEHVQRTIQRYMYSLRAQLIIVIIALLMLGLGALLLMTGSQVYSMTLHAFIQEREVATLATSQGLDGPIEHWIEGETSPDIIQNSLKQSTTKLGIDFTALTADGDVLASTLVIVPAPPGDLPEIAAAKRGQLTHNIRGDTLYIAAPIVHEDGNLIGLVWANASMAPVWAELWGRWIALITATLMALGLAAVGVWWLSARIVLPVKQMTEVAGRMATGDLTVRADVNVTSRELSTLARAFNEMAVQVETMLHRQRDFVANASHELSSPLASVKLRAEALASGTVTGERAAQYAGDIDQEIMRLGKVVADLLQLSKTEGSSFERPDEMINVIDEVLACVREVRPHSNGKLQVIETNLAEDVPDLYVHPSDLHLMVTNLLINAIKYTPLNGSITVAARWQAPQLIIEVCDNGDGIPPADLSRVTERFFRVDRAHSNHVQGTGLGLTLVLTTAQHYGGGVQLHSTGVPGQGTQARLILYPQLASVHNQPRMDTSI